MNKGILVYDSFTDEAMKGNPAGVVLDANDLTVEQMQNIASEMRHSETAFLTGSVKEGWRIRFFTPSQEVDLCGHATIAYITAMVEEGLLPLAEGETRVEIMTNLGMLPVWIYRNKGQIQRVMMLQDSPQILREGLPKQEIAEALGLKLSDLAEELPIVKAYTGIWDLMIPIASMEDFHRIKPNFEAMMALSENLDVISFHAFVGRGKDVFARVRNFAPIVGILEEAATGTSNGALGAYLAEEGIIKAGETVIMEQGVEMKRRSLIQVHVDEENGKLKVYVGGKARRILKGELWL